MMKKKGRGSRRMAHNSVRSIAKATPASRNSHSSHMSKVHHAAASENLMGKVATVRWAKHRNVDHIGGTPK